jgi:hypothetical protein
LASAAVPVSGPLRAAPALLPACTAEATVMAGESPALVRDRGPGRRIA